MCQNDAKALKTLELRQKHITISGTIFEMTRNESVNFLKNIDNNFSDAIMSSN